MACYGERMYPVSIIYLLAGKQRKRGKDWGSTVRPPVWPRLLKDLVIPSPRGSLYLPRAPLGCRGGKCLFNLTFLGHISSLGEVRAELQAGTQGQELKQRGRERLFTGLLCSSLFSWLCFQLSTEMLVSYGNKKIRSGISSVNTWLRTHTSNFER